MTLPPHKIGDKGQRYVAQAENYPKEGWNHVGYSPTYSGAEAIAKSIMLHPCCTGGRILDRHNDTVVTLRHA